MSRGRISGGGDAGFYSVSVQRGAGGAIAEEAWCADLTEDLSGYVGVIEIAGDRDKGVNIQPGYNGNAAYAAARDGDLYPVPASPPKEGHQAGVYWNWAMRPGWQKWKPNYRYGVITAIDYEQNTCNVSLNACYSTDAPDGRGMDVNQGGGLSGVPIQYMSCNSGAFAVGDEVLVKFENFSWGSPKVIGFKDHPKACLQYIFIWSAGYYDEEWHSYLTVWDLPNDRVATDIPIDGSDGKSFAAFPLDVNGGQSIDDYLDAVGWKSEWLPLWYKEQSLPTYGDVTVTPTHTHTESWTPCENEGATGSASDTTTRTETANFVAPCGTNYRTYTRTTVENTQSLSCVSYTTNVSDSLSLMDVLHAGAKFTALNMAGVTLNAHRKQTIQQTMSTGETSIDGECVSSSGTDTTTTTLTLNGDDYFSTLPTATKTRTVTHGSCAETIVITGTERPGWGYTDVDDYSVYSDVYKAMVQIMVMHGNYSTEEYDPDDIDYEIYASTEINITDDMYQKSPKSVAKNDGLKAAIQALITLTRSITLSVYYG